MASLLKDSHTSYIVGASLATCATLIAARYYMKRQAAKKAAERRKAYPANTVILHQIGRGPYAPSFSPFPMKLETYLRMAKIPYQNDHTYEPSSKGKTPFITYNGEDIADSEFCIDFLNKKLHKDLNSHLNKQQTAIARSMRTMTDESVYWVIGLQRWFHNVDYKFLMTAIPLPKFALKRISKGFKDQAHSQGYGRHTQEELHSIGQGDLQALSDYLGTKSYLMGDEPCQEDCAIFAILSQIKWHEPGTSYEKMFKGDFMNLSDYCDRMKDRFWPDWDECNTAGGTKEATK